MTTGQEEVLAAPAVPALLSCLHHAARCLAIMALAAVAGLCFWAETPRLFGGMPMVVLSGSMAPRLVPGDVVIAAHTDPRALKSGAVVVFREPGNGRLVVHRLVRVTSAGELVTKGDANPTEDSTPVQPASVVGVARLRVPAVGLASFWWQTGDRLRALGAVLAVLMLLLIARTPPQRAGQGVPGPLEPG
ncbi:MAG: signal peptidase [Frankiales bacterium]|jgi:signal peptidase|nr:signal peptidase [Frankiales bacterium]